VVLVAEIMPTEDVWGGDLPAVFALRALARLDGSSLVVNRAEMDRVLGRDRRPSAAPRGKDLALRIDPGGSLCYFRNVLVNLSKMPFDVLVLLAKEAQAGPRWVSRDRIFELCWHEDWERGVEPNEQQITKMVSEVRGGFRAATGMSAKESRQLIARKSKRGYRLHLQPDEIEIT
jgi:DNA-binding winged helix-turn-helix (wHTH) protein